MGKLTILDHTGHSTIEWDPTIERSVEEVRAEFDRLMSYNGFAYAPTGAPGRYRHVTSFEPDAEEIIVRGRLVGG